MDAIARVQEMEARMDEVRAASGPGTMSGTRPAVLVRS